MNLAAAREAFQAVSYDLVVIDRRLPDGDGLQLLRGARKNGLSVPFIVLTATGGIEDRVEGLDQGADDYLCKPFKMVELVARVNAVLRRLQHINPHSLTTGNIVFDTRARLVLVESRLLAVARRETMLLEQLMRRSKQVVTREKLEGVLFGPGIEVSQNAIEASISRLRKLLAQAGADQTIHTVRGVGYCLAP